MLEKAEPELLAQHPGNGGVDGGRRDGSGSECSQVRPVFVIRGLEDDIEAGLDGTLRERLAAVGLCKPRSAATLGGFITDYIAGRTDAKPMTILVLGRAKRLLLTGDSLSGEQAAEWGLATEAPPPEQLDERFEALLERVARLPINQLVMMKMLVNQSLYSQGLHQTQLLGTFFDGIARHTEEGHGFVRRAAEGGFKQAVRERDEPFGDYGLEGFGVE